MTSDTGPRWNVHGLREAYRAGDLVLFLGAGVSLEHGLPAWSELVLRLLVARTARMPRLRSLPPVVRQALCAWLVDHFDSDPLVLARIIKHDLTARDALRGTTLAERRGIFLALIRRHLYRGADTVPVDRKTSLRAIADLLQRATATGRAPVVVTYNFDDLLERELAARGVVYHTVFGPRRVARRGVRIVHPHGFLPAEGPLTARDIVFAEDEYHRVGGASFHWAHDEVLGHLRTRTALFVGLSMTDPMLRRLLDGAHAKGEPPVHWLVQRRHEVRADSQLDVLRNVAERVKGYAGRAARAATLDPPTLVDAISRMLAQADAFDDAVFESMGVRMLWVSEHGEIPVLLEAVGAPPWSAGDTGGKAQRGSKSAVPVRGVPT